MRKSLFAALVLVLSCLAVQTLAASPSQAPRAEGLFVGAGWPVALLRYGFHAPFDIEARYAMDDGLAVASGRCYWAYKQYANFDLNAGAEAGYIDIHGAESLNGSGMETGLFAGVQVKLGSRLGLSLDVGPTWMILQADGQKVSAMEWVSNAGIYLRLF